MIYGPGKSAPPDNIDEIRQRLARPRASLSPSRDITEDYEQFRRAHFHALNEEAITQEFSTSLRKRNGEYAGRNMMFAKIAELTPVETKLSRPNPDLFVGEDPSNIPRKIRDEIGQYIASGIVRSPMVVNDFAEIKGPDGREQHLMNQVAYDGAIGARAMHSMRAFGTDSPPADKKARSFVTAYAGGQASFYASYMGQPAGVGATPYYTYHVAAESAIGSVDQYRRAQQYCRNIQDLATEERKLACEEAREALRRREDQQGVLALHDDVVFHHTTT